MSAGENGEALLMRLRQGKTLTFGQQLALLLRLSLPAMVAQLSFIAMQYIDASMVGRLGADASAAIGLVSTSTWLFGGACTAVTCGFTVQAAQQLGAGREALARQTVKQGLLSGLGVSLALAVLGLAIGRSLPAWLGGAAAIQRDAANYFLIYALSLPFVQMNSLAGGFLQSSGNMRAPSVLNMLMCLEDVVFNLLLIFPARSVLLLGQTITLPGAGLGTAGAALGTALAEAMIALVMLAWLLLRSRPLRLRSGEGFVFSGDVFKKALRIAVPVGFEQMMMSGAMVMATRIIAPLGATAIAANSFAVTAESFCYMPGYGIGMAATAIVGQSIGAGRRGSARRLGWLAVGLGMVVMSVAAVLMYAGAPLMIGLLSPDAAIRTLGAAVLRIEAFAEPLYGASIVASGVFRGAGDTLVPSGMNFLTMWCVRLPLAAYLAPRLGLRGVWIAMCTELCVRGAVFLLRLARGRWLKGAALERL